MSGLCPEVFFSDLFLKRMMNSVRPEFLATDPEVLGSIPGATRFSEK
jgi:hypothetical protein